MLINKCEKAAHDKTWREVFIFDLPSNECEENALRHFSDRDFCGLQGNGLVVLLTLFPIGNELQDRMR